MIARWPAVKGRENQSTDLFQEACLLAAIWDDRTQLIQA